MADAASLLAMLVGPILVGLTVFLTTLRLLRQKPRYPPGPRGLPLLGFLPVLKPGTDKFQLFGRLRETYGDIFSFPLGCQRVVVVNGWESIRKVFQTQGGAFVDRPQVFTFTHLGQGKGVVNSSGHVWKEHRKFLLQNFRDMGIGKSSFEVKVQEELQAFCQILDNTKGAPFDPGFALQTAIANVICSIAFGKRFHYDDPVFVKFLQIFDENMSLAGGIGLLNFFPFLHSLPGDLFKSHHMLRNVDFVQSYLRDWLNKHQENLIPGMKDKDFIHSYLVEMMKRKESRRGTTFSYDQLLKLVGDLLVGGTETTGTTLRWCLIFLVHWQHVQDKMRQEIDAVFPPGTLPSVVDRRKLPYVEASILECQRFADIAPFSVTHSASVDTDVDGMFIPKGTIVVPNIRSVHFDPQLWTDPQAFRPERFLDVNGALLKPPDYLIPFFLGKRSCPGKGLASLELFTFITTLLQRYTIHPATHDTLPSLTGHLGITYTPYPYSVRFVRRQEQTTSTEKSAIASHSNGSC